MIKVFALIVTMVNPDGSSITTTWYEEFPTETACIQRVSRIEDQLYRSAVYQGFSRDTKIFVSCQKAGKTI